jgi:hypothetical protein
VAPQTHRNPTSRLAQTLRTAALTIAPVAGPALAATAPPGLTATPAHRRDCQHEPGGAIGRPPAAPRLIAVGSAIGLFVLPANLGCNPDDPRKMRVELPEHHAHTTMGDT